MKRRFWASVALAAIGAGLLVSAGFAGPQSAAKGEARGGTLRVDLRTDWDYIDPSLAYFSQSWQILNATNLKLLGFPDKEGPAGSRMVAQAAAGFPRVSRDGKTYTFTVRPGFKFSNGAAVTAANFAASINRALIPRMQSPASSFLDDVVGAAAVTAGRARTASGVRASGMTLTVRLTKVAPDFLARMTMPFFSAIPTNLATTPEGVGAPLVSAGPYYVREWTPQRSAVVLRNPHWNNARQPWKALGRPANVDRMTFTVGNSLEAIKLRLDRNETDLGNIPPAAASELSDRFGINKGRFFIRKQLVTWYLGLNTTQSLFRGNTKLRQAVNWAIDRPQLVRQYGFLGGGRTDQILPPGMPGYRDARIYPLTGVNQSMLARARALARGNTRNGKATLYTWNAAPGPGLAQVVQFNLRQIGIDVEIKTYDRVVQHEKSATRGEPFDITIEGWGADYADPYNFLNVLLDGRRIQATNNVNVSYFNDPRYNARMEQVSKLSGDARYNGYAKLDADITRDQAPLAPFINTNAKIFVSQDVGCYSYSTIGGSTNLVAVCKK
jgi:peptide/nickel transport system substrate-binding protein